MGLSCLPPATAAKNAPKDARGGREDSQEKHQGKTKFYSRWGGIGKTTHTFSFNRTMPLDPIHYSDLFCSNGKSSVTKMLLHILCTCAPVYFWNLRSLWSRTHVMCKVVKCEWMSCGVICPRYQCRCATILQTAILYFLKKKRIYIKLESISHAPDFLKNGLNRSSLDPNISLYKTFSICRVIIHLYDSTEFSFTAAKEAWQEKMWPEGIILLLKEQVKSDLEYLVASNCHLRWNVPFISSQTLQID